MFTAESESTLITKDKNGDEFYENYGNDDISQRLFWKKKSKSDVICSPVWFVSIVCMQVRVSLWI